MTKNVELSTICSSESNTSVRPNIYISTNVRQIKHARIVNRSLFTDISSAQFEVTKTACTTIQAILLRSRQHDTRMTVHRWNEGRRRKKIQTYILKMITMYAELRHIRIQWTRFVWKPSNLPSKAATIVKVKVQFVYDSFSSFTIKKKNRCYYCLIVFIQIQPVHNSHRQYHNHSHKDTYRDSKTRRTTKIRNFLLIH